MSQDTPTPRTETLTHKRNCAAFHEPITGTEVNAEQCTCGLKYRIQTQTAETLLAAWQKRCGEAERELAAVNEKLARLRELAKAHVHAVGDEQRETAMTEKPLPPEIMVSASQETVHTEIGNTRVAMASKPTLTITTAAHPDLCQECGVMKRGIYAHKAGCKTGMREIGAVFSGGKSYEVGQDTPSMSQYANSADYWKAMYEAEREAHKQTSRQANEAIETANAACAVALIPGSKSQYKRLVIQGAINPAADLIPGLERAAEICDEMLREVAGGEMVSRTIRAEIARLKK